MERTEKVYGPVQSGMLSLGCPCPMLSGPVCGAGANLGCPCNLLSRPVCGAGANPVWEAESGVPLPPAVWASLWCWGQSVMPLAPCCLESICAAWASCPLSQSVVLGPVWCPCPLLSRSVCSAGACLGCSCPLLPRPICGAGACLGCLERQCWMLNSRRACATGYAVHLLLEATGVH